MLLLKKGEGREGGREGKMVSHGVVRALALRRPAKSEDGTHKHTMA